MGVIGIGPIASIQGILLNGQQIFGVGWIDPDFQTPGSALVYGQNGVGEGYQLHLAALNGSIEIHWGFENAAQSPTLGKYFNHPPYKGIAYVVLVNCLFGTEQETAPNIEFVVTAAPNQSIITGPSAALDSNGYANMVACAAELATAWHGLNLPVSSIDVAAFQAMADLTRTDTFMSQLATGSPIWKDSTDARTMFGDCGSLCDLWFGFNLAGLLTIGIWYRGGPTGEVSAITANEWTTPPKDATDDMTAIPTRFDVTFTDQTQLYQETSAPTNNPMAMLLGAIGKAQQLRRTMLNTSAQAHIYGGEALRLQGVPTITGSVVVRESQAYNPDGTPIRPGGYFELDTQQEPGQTGELQLCRCTGRTLGPEGPITLEYEYDPGTAPMPYTVPYSNNAPLPEVVGPIGLSRILSLPPAPGQAPEIYLLAIRNAATWTGVQVFEDDITTGDFTLIGSQIGFALPTEVVSAIGQLDTVITVTPIPGQPTYDLSYLSGAVGVDSDSAARNNTLLCILVRKNPTTGLIVMNGTLPWVEICSVVEAAIDANGHYQVTVLRGRLGSFPLAFDTQGGSVSFPDAYLNYEAWFIPSALLTGLSHNDFPLLAIAGGTAYFEFAPFTRRTNYTPTAAYAAGLQASPNWTQYSYAFPIGYATEPVVTISAPATGANTDTSGNITLTFSIADPAAVQARISAFSVLSADGSSNYTSFLDNNVLTDGAFAWSGNIVLPDVEGLHTVTVKVVNADGQTAVATTQVYRKVPSSGYSLNAPTVSPAGGKLAYGSILVTITAPAGSSGTAQIQWQIGSQTGAWSSGGAGVTSVTVNVPAQTVFFARMMDTGPVYSAVVTAFYPSGS